MCGAVMGGYLSVTVTKSSINSLECPKSVIKSVINFLRFVKCCCSPVKLTGDEKSHIAETDFLLTSH